MGRRHSREFRTGIASPIDSRCRGVLDPVAWIGPRVGRDCVGTVGPTGAARGPSRTLTGPMRLEAGTHHRRGSRFPPGRPAAGRYPPGIEPVALPGRVRGTERFLGHTDNQVSSSPRRRGAGADPVELFGTAPARPACESNDRTIPAPQQRVDVRGHQRPREEQKRWL